MEWISYGDDNTMTFFARAKQRKLASYIYQIKDTKGNLVEGFDRVGQTMMTFYKALLGEKNTIRQIITQEVVNQGPTLSKEQQVHMGNEFTDLEIKEAIFSIPNTKSPGPDGFSRGFFKTTWQKIGPLICSAKSQDLQKAADHSTPNSLPHQRLNEKQNFVLEQTH
ncbi:hypothetical protein Cgig2_008803 [Carnegiea gigantea]|uniref:Uncharacterized protein n=1 Tax=Carnegiea gigantea TaxID=171969 RepID=A0A9Q1GPD6_9CARY|nr:hypothetical protein Cgig2_008803 [Carnegiea gigantea]